MKPLQRYLFKQIAFALGFVTILLVSTIWLVTSLRFVDYIINRGLPLLEFVSLVGLMLPGLLNVTLPLSAFAATLFVFQRADQDSELVVMRAAGVSPLSLAKPAVAIGLLVCLITYAIGLALMPLGQRAFKDWQAGIRDNYAQIALQEGAFNPLGPGVTVFLRERVSDGELRGLLIHNEADPRRPETLLAERGVITNSDTGPQVLMVNGSRQVVDRDTGRLTFLSFKRYVFQPSLREGQPQERIREANERFLHELFITRAEETLSERIYQDFFAEGHSRLSSPLNVIAFVLIAAAAVLSGERARRRSIFRPLIAVLSVAVMTALSVTIRNMIADGAYWAAPGLYLVPVVGVICAVAALSRAPRVRTAQAAA